MIPWYTECDIMYIYTYTHLHLTTVTHIVLSLIGPDSVGVSKENVNQTQVQGRHHGIV